MSCGQGPGNKQRGEGVGAAGDHLEWSVVVAVTSPHTHLHARGGALMY